MKIEANTIEEYLGKVGERENDARALDGIIRRSAPHLKPVLVSGMIGYGMMSYQTKSMKEPGQWPLIALAAQKNHMSIYICAVIDGEYIAEKYAHELGHVSVGKSCIRFKKIEDLTTDTLTKILTDLDKRYVDGEELYSL
jgi:hypothetical protein